MLFNKTNQGFVDIKGCVGNRIKRVPIGHPVMCANGLQNSNITSVEVMKEGTITSTDSNLKALLNKDLSKLAVRIHLYNRAPKNAKEEAEEVFTAFTKVVLHPTIRNNSFSIETNGCSIKVYLDNTTPKIQVRLITYYKIKIDSIFILPTEEISLQCAKSSASIYKDTSDLTFTVATTPKKREEFVEVIYAEGLYVAASGGNCSNGLLYSLDGITWVQSNIASGSTRFLKYLNGLFFASTYSYTNDVIHFNTYYSTDGKTWYNISLSNMHAQDIQYNGNIYVGSFYNTDNDDNNQYSLYYSTDGKIWTKTSISSEYIKVWYTNGIFHANSTTYDPYYSYAYYSTDGKTWTQITLSDEGRLGYSSSGVSISQILYANGIYMLNTGNSLEYSTDGIIWYQKNSSSSKKLVEVMYADGMWLLAWADNSSYGSSYLLYSLDGVNWNNCKKEGYDVCVGVYNTRGGGIEMSYGDGIWIAADRDSSTGTRGMHYSTDGINWTQSDTSKEHLSATSVYHGAISIQYVNGRFIINTGYDLLYSYDGNIWTLSSSGKAGFGYTYVNGMHIMTAYEAPEYELTIKSRAENIKVFGEYNNSTK